MVPVNQQLKFRGIPLNQTPPQINSFQGYSVTQPNFDRFTGKLLRPIFSPLATIHRYSLHFPYGNKHLRSNYRQGHRTNEENYRLTQRQSPSKEPLNLRNFPVLVPNSYSRNTKTNPVSEEMNDIPALRFHKSVYKNVPSHNVFNQLPRTKYNKYLSFYGPTLNSVYAAPSISRKNPTSATSFNVQQEYLMSSAVRPEGASRNKLSPFATTRVQTEYAKSYPKTKLTFYYPWSVFDYRNSLTAISLPYSKNKYYLRKAPFEDSTQAFANIYSHKASQKSLVTSKDIKKSQHSPPVIFTQNPRNYYVHLPTSRVIENLKKMGDKVVTEGELKEQRLLTHIIKRKHVANVG